MLTLSIAVVIKLNVHIYTFDSWLTGVNNSVIMNYLIKELRIIVIQMIRYNKGINWYDYIIGILGFINLSSGLLSSSCIHQLLQNNSIVSLAIACKYNIGLLKGTDAYETCLI